MNFKSTYAALMTLFALIVLGKTNAQICDKLSKNHWLPYDVSSVDKVPGIYAIGEKRGSETKYLYVGRSNDVKRRLQEHKSQKKQDIDKRVASKFKQHKESDLRIKYVPEQRQKTKEGAYMQCMKEKIGKRPELNKREGDGCTTCARGQKKSKTTSTTKSKTGSKKHSSGKPSSSAQPKVASSGRSSSSPKMPSRAPSRSSGSPKVSSGTSSRSSGSAKVSSGRASSRSSGGPKVSSGTSSRSSGSPKVSSGRASSRSSGGPKVSSGRSSFRSSGRRK
ncbi:uncharacterized protein LOC144631554 [Oculina patagonica]